MTAGPVALHVGPAGVHTVTPALHGFDGTHTALAVHAGTEASDPTSGDGSAHPAPLAASGAHSALAPWLPELDDPPQAAVAPHTTATPKLKCLKSMGFPCHLQRVHAHSANYGGVMTATPSGSSIHKFPSGPAVMASALNGSENVVMSPDVVIRPKLFGLTVPE